MSVQINSDFTVRINTGVALAGYPTTDIWYRKPNSSVEVNLGGAIDDVTYIQADVPDTTNDTAGKWLFRTHFITATGEEVNGPAIFINVKETWDPWSE